MIIEISFNLPSPCGIKYAGSEIRLAIDLCHFVVIANQNVTLALRALIVEIMRCSRMIPKFSILLMFSADTYLEMQ